MRAMSAQRKESGRANSTPEELLATVAELGYRQPEYSTLPVDIEARRFSLAMNEYQSQNTIAYPTCEDVLAVLNRVGYVRYIEDAATVIDGLPIDRRRKEEERREQQERRASLEPGAQELLDLTEEEHQFLDALKTLRRKFGREFAASEELLSIIWDLGYRSVGADGVAQSQLNDAERCRIQIAFTRAVEQTVPGNSETQFLTARSVFEITTALGFQKTC